MTSRDRPQFGRDVLLHQTIDKTLKGPFLAAPLVADTSVDLMLKFIETDQKRCVSWLIPNRVIATCRHRERRAEREHPLQFLSWGFVSKGIQNVLFRRRSRPLGARYAVAVRSTESAPTIIVTLWSEVRQGRNSKPGFYTVGRQTRHYTIPGQPCGVFQDRSFERRHAHTQ